MPTHQYIYCFSYDYTERELCQLESQYIFGREEENKLLISEHKVAPSSSAFIKKRLDVMFCFPSYATLIDSIKQAPLAVEGFKVEYLVLDGDTTSYKARLSKLREIGDSIDAIPNFKQPTMTYALCFYEGLWYFGVMHKDDFHWHKHKEKPRSYSNSIGQPVAKTLVNIASKMNKDSHLFDACCGAGTIMLEACFEGYTIDGGDINWKMCRHARENLAYFGYSATVYRSDIQDIEGQFDAVIVDLPYNILSHADDDQIQHIITSATAVANRLVIVSTTDISKFIAQAGLKIENRCSVSKRGKSEFTRQIWVCEKV